MEDRNKTLMKIASSIGGITMVMVIMVLVFAKQELWILAPIVGFMSLFGVCMGYFVTKK